MKKLSFLGIIFGCTWCFQACNMRANNSDNASDDSIIVIKHGKPVGDTSSNNTRPNVEIVAESGDTRFAVEAASGGMTEVALGKMAVTKALDKRIRNFGAMMVKDHSKANIKLAALAKAKNILLPFNPLSAGQKVIDELREKSGKDFEKAYINEMIEDHKSDIKVFEDASKNGQDADIKAFATKSLVALRNHLEAISTIRDSRK